MSKEKNALLSSMRGLLTTFLLFVTVAMFGQDITVRGTVTDTKGEPVIGATVKVEGANTGVVTNIDGEYTLKCAPNATLTFSYIGFNTRKEPVNNRTRIDVKFKENST